jgi:hypothetical protein
MAAKKLALAASSPKATVVDKIRTCFVIVRPFSGGDFLESGELS